MLLLKTKLQKLIWYKWNDIQKYALPRDGMTMCGIQNVLAIDKVDETVAMLYDTTRKESSEI